uniref:Secreted protein n=1 Tax=Haemonchus placei TaxID=6290 RepID=A0A0N4X5Q6_HAEPC
MGALERFRLVLAPPMFLESLDGFWLEERFFSGLGCSSIKGILAVFVLSSSSALTYWLFFTGNLSVGFSGGTLLTRDTSVSLVRLCGSDTRLVLPYFRGCFCICFCR